MKRIFALTGLMTAAVFTLTNCQPKEFVPETPGFNAVETYTINAGIATRTSNDGMSTIWEEKDSVCVFNAPAGTTNYSDNAKGTIKEGAGTSTAVFSVAGTAPSGKNDWYLLFPYSSKITTPGTRTEGYTYIGHSKGAEQDGYDSKAHLRGTLCPLYGVAKNADGSNVSVTMKNLASVIDFEVTNNTGSAIVITSLKLDESTDIVGSYFIDITGDAPVYNPSDDKYVYKSATVKVKNGAELANGKSAHLYLPVKPYTHDSSKTLDITVNMTVGGTAASQTVNLKPAAAKCNFEAGKIKKVAVKLAKMEDPNAPVSISSIDKENTEYTVTNAIVDYIGSQNFVIKDNTGVILVRMGSADNLKALSIKKGDKVEVKGNVTKGHNMFRFNNTDAHPVTLKKLSGSGSVSSPVTWTGAQFKAAYEKDNNAAFVTVEGKYKGSYMYEVDGAGDVLLYMQDSNGASPENGASYTITGYVYGWSLYNETTKEVIVYAESLTAKASGGDQVTYNKVSAITSGKKYLIVANNAGKGKTYAATAIPSNKNYGRLDGAEVTITNNSITRNLNEMLEFVITATDDGYSIKQSDGRLLGADSEHNGTFQIGDSYNHDFTFTIRDDGTWTIYYPSLKKTLYHGGSNGSTIYTNFSLHTDVPSDGSYPMLFERVD